MSKHIVEQKIGTPVTHWISKERPCVEIINGRYCHLEHVDSTKHFEDHYQVYGPLSNPKNWTYLPVDNFIFQLLILKVAKL